MFICFTQVVIAGAAIPIFPQAHASTHLLEQQLNMHYRETKRLRSDVFTRSRSVDSTVENDDAAFNALGHAYENVLA